MPSWTASSTAFGHFIEHLLEDLVFFLNLALVEIFDSLTRSAELDEDDWCLFDRDIPVILQIEYELPNWQAYKLRISLEELKIARDLHLWKVVAQSTNRSENVETSSLWLGLLRAEQIEHHRDDKVSELQIEFILFEELLVQVFELLRDFRVAFPFLLAVSFRLLPDTVSKWRVGQVSVAITDIYFQHRADQAIADWANVAPGRVQSILDVGPQLVDDFETHGCVPGVSDFKLRCWLCDAYRFEIYGVLNLAEVVWIRLPFVSHVDFWPVGPRCLPSHRAFTTTAAIFKLAVVVILPLLGRLLLLENLIFNILSLLQLLILEGRHWQDILE